MQGQQRYLILSSSTCRTATISIFSSQMICGVIKETFVDTIENRLYSHCFECVLVLHSGFVCILQTQWSWSVKTLKNIISFVIKSVKYIFRLNLFGFSTSTSTSNSFFFFFLRNKLKTLQKTFSEHYFITYSGDCVGKPIDCKCD